MRSDAADDVLSARLLAEPPQARADRRARERRETYLRAWTAAERAGARTDAEIGAFILQRLYPDLAPAVVERFKALLEERAAGGVPVLIRPKA